MTGCVNFLAAIALLSVFNRLETVAEMAERGQELRNSHFQRLSTGLQESVETSAIHLDILTYLKAIHGRLASVAHPILENRQ